MVRHYVDNRRPTLAVLLDDAVSAIRRRLVRGRRRGRRRRSCSAALALQLPIAARSTTEWLLGRLRPQGRDGMLETLTLVDRTHGDVRHSSSRRPSCSASSRRRRRSRSSPGRRPAHELLPMVTHLRSRARVIVIVVDTDGAGGDVPTESRACAARRDRAQRVDARRVPRRLERDPRMNRWPLPWRSWAAVLVVVILAIASTAGLHSITDDWSFLLPATLGALTAAAAFVIAVRFAPAPGETLAVALGLFVVGGVLTVSVLAAGEIPTPSSFGDFFDGLIRSWADLLSAVSPADLTPRLSVAPYAIAWFGAIVGCSLLRWSPLPGAARRRPAGRARAHRAADRRGPDPVDPGRGVDRRRRPPARLPRSTHAGSPPIHGADSATPARSTPALSTARWRRPPRPPRTPEPSAPCWCSRRWPWLAPLIGPRLPLAEAQRAVRPARSDRPAVGSAVAAQPARAAEGRARRRGRGRGHVRGRPPTRR